MGDEHHNQESGASNSTDHHEDDNTCEEDPETGEKVNETPKVTVCRDKDEPNERFEVVVSPPRANVYFTGTSFSGEAAAPGTNTYALGFGNGKTKRIRILPVATNKEQDNMNIGDSNRSTSCIVARNIPPYDASATTPIKAYPLDKIIEEEEWDSLQDIYLLLQDESVAAAVNAYPLFVRNRLHKLRDIEDDSEKKMLSAALSLLTHLVKFKNMYSTGGFVSAKGHKFPGIIHQKCVTLFKKYPFLNEISIDKTNLMISYVLVLALHVDNFKTDPEDIAKDLKMSAIELRKHLASLGCKLSWEKSILVATLPTPLKFSESKLNTRRRKRAKIQYKG
ncbi:hypothetical protein CARUB_v10015593mg [Capsella rubella]|uniref:Uncharacterized protein n=1 Tax=Capsella rubella TaxID=81985 RepID=R0G9U8_9BRAS|nr:DNA-directed RNA polymerase I subunit rpa49 [Capsella rubella]EOA32331.1 hypothetical protein CARUB_v10015593mg [Capsella rubella]